MLQRYEDIRLALGYCPEYPSPDPTPWLVRLPFSLSFYKANRYHRRGLPRIITTASSHQLIQTVRRKLTDSRGVMAVMKTCPQANAAILQHHQSHPHQT